MAASNPLRYDFVLSRRSDSDAYALWRFDPEAQQLLTALPLGAQAAFDRSHAIVQVGSYLLEWGSLSLKAYEPCFPFRLFSFDPTSDDPLNAPAVQKGLWTKTKFWAYRPDFGNPHGANEGYDSGEQLMLLPLGGFVLNVIPTDGRGTYQLWNFDPGHVSGGLHDPLPGSHADPLPAPYSPQGGFDQIEFGHELLPMGNYVLDRNGSRYAVYSFDPQAQPPLALPAVQQGEWSDIDASHRLAPIGDLVLDWTPADRRYRLWCFDPSGANPLTGPGGRPLREGVLPEGFDAATTLLGIQPPIPIDPARAALPGTVDFMRSKIKHVVYLMLENRSFDHLVGWLYAKGDARIHFVGHDEPYNGASTEMFNLDPSDGNKKVCVQQFNGGAADGNVKSTDFLPQDPYHDKSDVMRQLYFTDRKGYQARAVPDMKGFVWNNGVEQVMWGYTPEQLPVINGLASSFAISDEWFSSMPGATDPNRAFAFTGSAMMKLNNWQNGFDYINWPDYPHRQSIWKVLWSNGISDWKMYNSVEWINFVHTYHLFLQGQVPYVDKNVDHFIFPIKQFKDDARHGKLPAFSYLEPAWIAPTGTTSYHPGADLIPGERALEELYAAVRSGPAWNETLFIITFDEHGGIFDHAPPPFAANPWPNDANDGFHYDLMGVRVPTVIVSPWVDEHTVFRSGQATPFDSTSILATLLNWFGVPHARWALGDRTDEAPTFETVLTRSSARTDAPQHLPVPFDKTFPQDSGGDQRVMLHDLHRLMAPRAVWAIVKGRVDAREAQRIADDIMAQADDLKTLHGLLAHLARQYA